MKILMIAPQPFFEPRGTPFSEYFRIQALCALGHEVHLVTYPIGEDKAMPGLTIFRAPRPFGIRRVKTGPSAAKIFLDIAVFFKAWGRLLRNKYDLLHTHEEACIMGAFLGRLSGIPHLYDMHSSLAQQMDNFQFSRSRLLTGFFRFIERVSLRNARSVIVICRALQEYAAGITRADKLTVIENFIEDDPGPLPEERLRRLRAEVNPDGRTLVLYAGTFEAYQGLPLLLESFALLDDSFRLLLVGGKEEQVEAMRRETAARGIGDRVVIQGRRPAEEMPWYLACADVLVSPRSRGTNIPLKIYSYLRSGVPVVATDLYTHTQSINGEIAVLTPPEPTAMAAAIRRAAGEEGRRVAAAAQRFCAENYSHARYRELVGAALAKAAGPSIKSDKGR